MTYEEKLQELASSLGVATSYWSATGELVTVPTQTLEKTVHALGVQLQSPTCEAVDKALQDQADAAFTRMLPPCVVSTQGSEYVVNVHVHDGAPAELSITLEDGSTRETYQWDNWTPAREIDGVRWGEASFALPQDLPLGWHTLTLRSEETVVECSLIITPQRLSTADTYVNNPVSGVMAQLYSVRSENSWGMGDFHDLGQLAEITAGKADADFLLINPLHAGEPIPPVEDSPYLPTTRRFINPLYIRIEDIPEFAQVPADIQADMKDLAKELGQANHSAEIIDRNSIYGGKLACLHEIFRVERSAEREAAFQAFKDLEGDGLVRFAWWCARYDAQAQGTHAQVDEVELTEFYSWLQWVCDEQLHLAQLRATDAGMKIGIMADLAVGVHPGGADAENLAYVLAPEASVGAPPDIYNQRGQDWSQPPWHPVKLAEAGYRPWRDMLRTVLRNAGGIRVDHILGLFRLFWIPRGQEPTTGTYVSYDHNALVGILALEAERAGAVVVGEDLGTFEPWVQEALASRGIMGTSILWFEHADDGGATRPEDYRALALSSVTTHDLPPTAGMLHGEHIALRDRLGLFTNPVDEEEREDLHWQNTVLARVADYGCFHDTGAHGIDFHDAARGQRGEVADLLVGLHRYIARTPSALTCTSLVDMVGDKRTQNQPGTVKEQYPNWCVPLCDATGAAVVLEDLAGRELFGRVAQAGARERG